MIRNYILTAWRHLQHNGLFSAINIFGLAVGMMSCILILVFVRDELSYDRWIPNSEHVVRMHTAFVMPDRPPFMTVRSAGRMMEAIRDYAPDLIKAGVRLAQIPLTIKNGDSALNESVVFADRSFFDVLELPFVQGSAATSFLKPTDLVITEEMAIKYFGRTDVLGESLTVCCIPDEPLDLQVTGVIRNLPENTHLDIDFLTVLKPEMFDFAPNLLNTWTSVNTYTYFRLADNADVSRLKARVDHWLDNESPIRDRFPEGARPSEMLHLKFMPVPEIHLKARADAGSMGDFRVLGDITVVYAFIGVAVLILLTASINFMNLSTARASRRAREVALRKVMGASRGHVVAQFMGEAVAIALISLLFALVAVEVVMPLYNQVMGRTLSITLYNEPWLLLALVGAASLVGAISGWYPALMLSRYLPAKALKANQSGESAGQGRIRFILVVVQFSVSIGLAVCTVVVFGQTLYARALDVGYSYDSKLVLYGLDASGAALQQDAIVNELARIDGVTHVVLSSEVPSQDNENNRDFTLIDGPEGTADSLVLNYYTVGFGFFEAYDMELVAGRSFDEAFGTDQVRVTEDGGIGKASVIINASAARQLGFGNPADAVGKTLRAEVFDAGMQDLTIIGIARDVYFRSIKFGVRSSVFINYPPMLGVATIRFNTMDVDQLVGEVEHIWREMVPDAPASHQFLTDMIYAQYQSEENQGTVFAAFSLLAVIIACLGLYGLASFAAERRTREIGIRKVMGARIRDIVTLLLWQFSIPVLIANVIAWPVAWFLMTKWLEGFAYRLDTSFILLASLVAGIVALLIAWLTVAGRALRVANANPITALRSE